MSLTITRDDGPNDVYFKHESFIVSDGDELAYFRKAEDAELFVKAKATPTTESIIAMMRGLATDAERLEVLIEFCHSCGCVHPDCQCWNGE